MVQEEKNFFGRSPLVIRRSLFASHKKQVVILSEPELSLASST